MRPRHLVSLGVGGTAFLAASVLGFELFGGEFPSVFYVLPIAFLAGIVAALGAFVILGARPGGGVRSALNGVAAIGYAFFLFWFVRYSIAPTRAVLSFDRIAVLAVCLGTAVAALSWRFGAGTGGK
jgi:hypothetical protein